MLTGFEGVLVRGVFSVWTLYMVAILLRWFGGYLQVGVESGRWRWIPRMVDPLIQNVRRWLPEMGPVDLGPLFALLLVWFFRQITVWALILMMRE